ncbi:hypothetical protein BS50DRAFT_584770 [Corynespora cassiicola Philippines]|uniref:Mid2 domain-containing protein n=1 Tax=Corynespora cassiicola Philippines TaxID=1448308 RepID=A0A2T2P0P8_CORCC|nr:hypothetical protein BS50DRAFT_584770 [Corynespora cassiicola Philippines]
MTSSAEFNPTCQSGASWYTCNDASLFVGCCTRDPCNSVGCSQGDLSPVAYNPETHGTYPDASCPTGVNFWSCSAGRTFWGCCKSNPCSEQPTCPSEDLVPAYLGSPVQIAWYISTDLPSSSTKTAQSRPASTVKASTSTSSPIIAVTSTPSTTGTSRISEIPGASTPGLQSEPNSSKPLGAIIGGAVGGAVGLLLIIALMLWYCLHARNSRQAHNQTVSDQRSEFSPSRMTGNAWERATYVPPQYGEHTHNLYIQ